MKKLSIIIILFYISSPLFLSAQDATNIEDQFPEFKLKSYKGKTIENSTFKDKNVVYIFPRGKVGDHWCQICHYHYADLTKYDKENKLSKNLNLEIIFVLPYSTEEVNNWVEVFPKQMEVIHGWKNPEKITDENKWWTETTRKIMPEDIQYKDGNVPLPFTILVDEKQELSKKLGLFTMFWHGSYVDQNIPTIYALDKTGKVKFKYMSQNTFDRLNSESMEKILKALLN